MEFPPSSLRVLLVENDEQYAAFVRVLLEEGMPGIKVDRVATATAAVVALGDGTFDVVLLDLGLPDVAGLATVHRVCAVDKVVPIIILTSTDNDMLGLQAVQQGAQDYLVKSRTDAELLRRSIHYARERAEWRRDSVRRDAEMRQSHKMEAIGRLAGGVAHDFNNVLTAIFGYVDLLLEQFPDDDPRRDDVQEIRHAAERAATLTRQLLAFSRKQMIQPQILDLNDVVGSLHKLLARLVGEDVVIEIEAEPELGSVMADPGQIEQVLMNLAANGRDAMPDGGTLTIGTGHAAIEVEDPRHRPGLRPGAYVTLTVSDTGTGIPQDAQVHIFEPFYTTKAQGKGTGLGLATVYGIVKQNGGGIYLDPEQTKGTRFVIYLPRVPSTVTSSV